MPKRDHFGIHLKTEDICLDCLKLSLKAAMQERGRKLPVLQELRILIEMLKQFVRLLRELHIISDGIYIETERQIREISKMAAGWMKYLQNKER